MHPKCCWPWETKQRLLLAESKGEGGKGPPGSRFLSCGEQASGFTIWISLWVPHASLSGSP